MAGFDINHHGRWPQATATTMTCQQQEDEPNSMGKERGRLSTFLFLIKTIGPFEP